MSEEEDYFSTCELSNPNNPELLLATKILENNKKMILVIYLITKS
jgi:hypothetical protein